MLVQAPARQIANESWQEFCQRFTDSHRGTRIAVARLEEGSERELARGIPLQNLRFERTSGCSDMLHLEAGETGDRTFLHSMTEPLHIKLYNEEGGRIVRIDSEDGITLIRFHSGRLDEILEGLKIAVLGN